MDGSKAEGKRRQFSQPINMNLREQKQLHAKALALQNAERHLCYIFLKLGSCRSPYGGLQRQIKDGEEN